MRLLPFQKRLIAAVESASVDTVALSGPRGCGKTALSGYALARAMTPGDPMFEPGTEQILASGSIPQCRFVLTAMAGLLRAWGRDFAREYRLIDTQTRLGARHKPTGTTIRAVGSNARTSLGIGASSRLIVFDEPASLHERNGAALYESLDGALGKPGSRLTLLLCGTRAPAAAGNWWPLLLDAGSSAEDRTYVQDFAAHPDRWRRWREVERVNPVKCLCPEARAKLRGEWEAAKAGRKTDFFKAWRLNIPGGGGRSPLIRLDRWERVLARPAAAAEGPPVIGFDLGGTRAWSAAVALWPSGRCEALAVCGGEPPIRQRELDDRVPAGTYEALAESGSLLVDEGHAYPRASFLADCVRRRWPGAERAVCDRFRAAQIADEWHGELEARVSQWSESTADIDAFRTLAVDGGLSVAEGSRRLLTVSMSAAQAVADGSGNERLQKSGDATHTARDDCASALVLAAGAAARRPKPAAITIIGAGGVRVIG